jgi:hypothetical protein
MVYTAADFGSACPRASSFDLFFLIFPPAKRVLSTCPRASIFFWFCHQPKGCFLPNYQKVLKLKRNKKVPKRTGKRSEKRNGKELTMRALQPKGCFLPDCQKVPKLKRSQKVTKKEPGKKYRKKETHISTCCGLRWLNLVLKVSWHSQVGTAVPGYAVRNVLKVITMYWPKTQFSIIFGPFSAQKRQRNGYRNCCDQTRSNYVFYPWKWYWNVINNNKALVLEYISACM